MPLLQTMKLKESSIAYLQRLQGTIDFDPAFQRQGDIWDPAKKQLLVDSIINDYDIPKLYLHELPSPTINSNGHTSRYALIDGKQRLEAVYGFLNNEFPLADDFEFFRDESIKLGGLRFHDLLERHPAVAAIFLESQLDIVIVRTDDDDLIEDMFSRLNEAVPLNSAERRNAWSGAARDAVKRLIDHEFFTDRLPFEDRRYRHQDLATKFLSIEHQDDVEGRLIDTKRARLDQLYLNSRDNKISQQDIFRYENSTRKILDDLVTLFWSKDKLLTSIGSIVVYYLLTRNRHVKGLQAPSTEHLKEFEFRRRTTLVDEDAIDFHPGNLAYKEYNRLVQSSNDGKALTRRVVILETYLSAIEEGKDPVAALATLDPLP